MDLELYKKSQEELAKKIILKDSFKEYITIAGFDIIYKGHNALCSGVIIDKAFNIIESIQNKSKPSFPYIPGLLAFREGPLIIETLRLFKNKPDILIVKGHGILHFRGAGLASYVGVAADIPAIGVAKDLLIGEVKDGEVFIGDELKGYKLKTKEGSNPIYVSPGHKISLETSKKIIEQFINKKHKLPEPLHLAHKFILKMKKMVND